MDVRDAAGPREREHSRRTDSLGGAGGRHELDLAGTHGAGSELPAQPGWGAVGIPGVPAGRGHAGAAAGRPISPSNRSIDGVGWPGKLRAYTVGVDYFFEGIFGQFLISGGLGDYDLELQAQAPAGRRRAVGVRLVPRRRRVVSALAALAGDRRGQDAPRRRTREPDRRDGDGRPGVRLLADAARDPRRACGPRRGMARPPDGPVALGQRRGPGGGLLPGGRRHVASGRGCRGRVRPPAAPGRRRLDAGGRAPRVHLWPAAAVERTEGVKRFLAQVAREMAAFGAGPVVTTNISDLL